MTLTFESAYERAYDMERALRIVNDARCAVATKAPGAWEKLQHVTVYLEKEHKAAFNAAFGPEVTK